MGRIVKHHNIKVVAVKTNKQNKQAEAPTAPCVFCANSNCCHDVAGRCSRTPMLNKHGVCLFKKKRYMDLH